MIFFNNETFFTLKDEHEIVSWVKKCIQDESKEHGEINFIFCDDSYLLEINIKYLNHNTLTDIITFDYTLDDLVGGDVFISIDRVKENAADYKVSFKDELHRVIVHGILHLCGYKDKTTDEKKQMRAKEDYYLSLRTFV